MDERLAAMADEEFPVHPFTGFTALGLTKTGRPIWPVVGAAEDDEGDNTDEDTDSDESDDDGDGDKDEFTPPSKEEWAKTQAALAKANKEAKKHRLENKTLKAAASTEPEAVKRARDEAAKETEGKLKPGLVRSAAKAEFAALGAPVDKPEKLSRLVKMLDLDELEIDDDGDVVGLTDQIKALKVEWPELFGKARVGKGDTSDRDPAGKKKTSAQLIAERVNSGAA